jgi:cell shape-determining protein MreC
MRPQNSGAPKAAWRVAAPIVLLAVGMLLAPPQATILIQSLVRDAAWPGQRAVAWISAWSKRQFRQFAGTDDKEQLVVTLQAEVNDWKLRHRRLQVETALLREQLAEAESHDAPSIQPGSTAPLLVPHVASASVLGPDTAAAWRSHLSIDAGKSHGVEESSLVLEDGRPLIDQGEDAGIGDDQPVYFGRVVVGKIARAGRWSSSVALLTDATFRAKAQLVRHSDQGTRFGATGILEGQGQALCRLKWIAATEPIQPGDDVYTADRDGLFPYPMYFGKIVSAELEPGASDWSILVRPAIADVELRRVQVLKKSVNPTRLLAQ